MAECLKIDLRGILKKRIPGGKGKFIPGFVYALLERIVCQKELNGMLEYCYPAEGSGFSKKLAGYLKLNVETCGLENVPEEGRYVFASNHPLGGLDGISLIGVLGGKYGDDNVKFLVNDMLMNVAPLRNQFLPINKYGSQGRKAAMDINAEYAGDRQMAVFPAGLVSRLHPDGEIKDLEWQKAFVTKAREYGRLIVPVRFEGLNRKRFYRLARWRKKLGIKVNLEQITLPSELVAARGRTFRVCFGKPVDPRDHTTPLPFVNRPLPEDALEAARVLRELTYKFKP